MAKIYTVHKTNQVIKANEIFLNTIKRKIKPVHCIYYYTRAMAHPKGQWAQPASPSTENHISRKRHKEVRTSTNVLWVRNWRHTSGGLEGSQRTHAAASGGRKRRTLVSRFG